MANIPTVIGRYKVIRAIGHGGMGALYLAWDSDLDRQVAIKVLRDDDPQLRERFAREAKSAARLKHHNIVTIFELGSYEGQPYIAMEYIQGRTLAEIIRVREPLPLARKLDLIGYLCEGLSYAHKAGVIHRDIKPANIMIDDDGGLKILDFGIARIAESASMTQAGMMLGTLNYMSPEQVSGLTVDQRSDIFAVGLVFYEFLAGKQAFPGTLSTGVLGRVLHGEPEPLATVCPGLDEEVIRIIARALQKDAANRYPDLGPMRREVLAARSRIEGATPAPIADTPIPHIAPPTPSPSVRRAPDREELEKRRASQVQYYLDVAARALEEERFDSAIAACDQTLLLDEDNARAIDVASRARAAIEAQQAKQLLADAERALRAGALTSAAQLVNQAETLQASPEQADLRRTIERALADRERERLRADTIRDAVERAQAAFDARSYTEAVRLADEVLHLDPGHAAAGLLKNQAVEARVRVAREAADRRARDAVRDAREIFAGGDHQRAIAALEHFEPAHELVLHAQAELQAEADRLAEVRRQEMAARAARQRVAGELALARDESRDGRFTSALERLRALERTEGGMAEISALIVEVTTAEAASRAAAERDLEKTVVRPALPGKPARGAAPPPEPLSEKTIVMPAATGPMPISTQGAGPLDDIIRTQPVPIPRPGPKPSPTPKPATPNRTALLAIVAAAVLILGFAGYKLFVSGGSPSPVVSEGSTKAPGPDQGSPAGPTPDPAFTRAMEEALASLAGKRFGPALQQLDALKSASPDDFARHGLSAQRDEAAAGRANELAAVAEGLLKADKLTEAKDKFEEAARVSPIARATSQIPIIDQRRKDFARFWQDAEAAVARKDYLAASSAYGNANREDPGQFKAQGGPARLQQVGNQLSAAQRAAAQQQAAETERNQRDAARKDAADLFNQGKESARQQRFDDADDKYTQAIAKDPANADAKAALARSGQYADRKRKAQADLRANNLDGASAALAEAKALDAPRYAYDQLDKLETDIANRRKAATNANTNPSTSANTGTPAPDPREAIRSTIERLAAALSTDRNPTKDPKRVQQVWPSFRGNPFDKIDGRTMVFESLQIVPSESTAVVTASRTTQSLSRGRVIDTTTEKVQVTLQKNGDVWIVKELRVLPK